MGNLLQLFARRCNKWVERCGCWELRGNGCRRL